MDSCQWGYIYWVKFRDLDTDTIYDANVLLSASSPNEVDIYNYTTPDGKELSPETIQHVKQFAYDLVQFEQGKSNHNPLKEYKDENYERL